MAVDAYGAIIQGGGLCLAYVLLRPVIAAHIRTINEANEVFMRSMRCHEDRSRARHETLVAKLTKARE